MKKNGQLLGVAKSFTNEKYMVCFWVAVPGERPKGMGNCRTHKIWQENCR